MERSIVQNFISGDVKAFERLFQKYARGMQLVALGLYRDTNVAEDAVQESFVYLWNHREEIDSELSLEGYLHTSVRHYVLNYIRHQNIRLRREEDIVREQEWMGREAVNEEEIMAKLVVVRRAIDALPEGCRRAFVMSVVEGMGYVDTAAELGVSVNTVKSQVKIAYRKLRSTMQDDADVSYLTILFLLFFQKNI